MEKQKCPEVRFKGYDQNWRLKKLEAIGIFNPYSNLPQEFEYVDLESVVGTELINSRKETIETAPSRAQRLASRGDVFYQAVRPYQKNNYLFDLPYDNYVFSTGYIQIRPTINSYYLLSIVQKNDFVQKVLENCTGTSYPAINTTGLKSIDVFISNEANEQTQIGNFFQNLDQSIALQEKKLTQTQNLKKAMLEKMFPKAGSTQPEIRLKGFSGDWPGLRIFDLAQNGKLNNGVFNDQNKIGKGYKLINVLDMYIETSIDEKKLTLLDLDRKEFEQNKVKYGDVFFTRSSLVKEGIAFSNVYLGHSNDITYDGHLIKLSPNLELVDPIFLNYCLKSSKIRTQLILGGKSTTMTTIGQQEVGETIVGLPSMSEQLKIGQFFKRLDETLLLQQQKLQTLKNLKRAFLEKMFV